MNRATQQEIEFLRGLGSHATRLEPIPRLRLLARYRASMEWRYDWGEIDPGAVREAAEEMIEAEFLASPGVAA